MNAPILLDRATHRLLTNLLNDETLRPQPTADQRESLERLLKRASVTDKASELENRVTLNDRITLVSPRDSRDYFNLQVVAPEDADIDADRIPVLMPICLAVLGRSCLELVGWETPAGDREMRIIAIAKEEPAGV